MFTGLWGAWILPGKGGLGHGASGGAGCLIHVESTLQGVARDQASGVAVARQLVRMRMPAFPDDAPGQGVKMTEAGRLFVSVNP